MRAIVLSSIILILSACGYSGESAFEIMPAEEVSTEGVKRAKMFGHRMMNDCVNEAFELLNRDEATKDMVEGLTIGMQKDACDHIKSEFGVYHGLDFVECLRPSDGRAYVVYRFKTNFTNKRANAETRVILDGQDKLAGIWAGAWRDVTNL